MTVDFLQDLPVADIRIGRNQHMRIYGATAAEIGLPLVEVRLFRDGSNDSLHLTVAQAEAIVDGLIKAAAKATA